MSKYNEKLATQSFVKNSISNLMKTINNPDEAIEAGIYKVIDDDTIAQFDAYILIVQVKPDDSLPIRQTKLTSDGMTYSREFNQFEPPFPAFTQSTVSQNDMALFKLMVDSQFATIEDELERQRIITSVEGESIALPDSADGQLRGLRIFGKTTQADTPSIDNPQPLVSIGDDGSVDVKVYGKNLFNPSAITCGNLYNETDKATTSNSYGTSINSTVYDGNKIIVTQTAMGNPNSISSYHNGFVIFGDYNNTLRFNEEYTLIADYKITGNLSNVKDIYIGIQDSQFTKCTIANGKLYYNFVFKQSVANPHRRYLEIRCCGKSFELSNIMLVEGNAVGATPKYVPFVEQTLTIPTPNGLPGVPVSSDGNYTDASGQQWVCDEKDYGGEVYVQRVYTYIVTGDENWTISQFQDDPLPTRFDCAVSTPTPKGELKRAVVCLCSHLACRRDNLTKGYVWLVKSTPNPGLRIRVDVDDVETELRPMLKAQYEAGTPLTVIYELETPIETPLSAEEIAAYKALHTHCPSTSIHNSDNAHMAVDYVADTKNYVDNQIKKEVAELTAAILTQ